MIFPEYHSSNHHTVILYGRLWFIVTSASVKGRRHFVDLERSTEWKQPFLCTCGAFRYGIRPCRHIAACFEAISVWVRVPEQTRKEWIEGLMFKLMMGYSFDEAAQSPNLQALRTQTVCATPTKEPTRMVRKYRLHDPARTATKN